MKVSPEGDLHHSEAGEGCLLETGEDAGEALDLLHPDVLYDVFSVHWILSKPRVLVQLHLAVLVPAVDLVKQLLLHGLDTGLALDLDIDVRLLRQPRSNGTTLKKGKTLKKSNSFF